MKNIPQPRHLVILKSGGPIMEVVSWEEGQLLCEWKNDQGLLERGVAAETAVWALVDYEDIK